MSGPLLDAAQACQRRDAAIARVEAGADAEWKVAAAWAVYSVALSKRYFTGDDIWASGLPKPREARALGPVMLRAKRAGVIRPTGRVVASDVPGNHRNPHYEWESLIFGSEVAA